jgi:hypothetical protein
MTTDIARVRAYRDQGKSIGTDEIIGWYCRWRVDKFTGVDLAVPELRARMLHGDILPDDYSEGELNILTTVGATDLLNGLVTAGLATPWNSTNAGIAVGDSNSAASAGQTDMQAAAGTKLNAADPSSATNATPIVVAATYSPTPTVGSVVVCSAFSGAGASAINNTFELSAASGSSITLLNSAGSGSITVTGGLVKPLNRYLMILSGAPAVSTNTVQFTTTITANNANHSWAEMGIVLGQASTNKQSAAPTKLLDRFVAANGTKAQGSSWTPTVTITLS